MSGLSTRMRVRKDEARSAAKHRNHTLGRFTSISDNHVVAHCMSSDCNARVDVTLAQHSIDDLVIGTAVSADCPVSREATA